MSSRQRRSERRAKDHDRRTGRTERAPGKQRRAKQKAAGLRPRGDLADELEPGLVARLDPLGAVGGVTGSSLLLTTATSRVLFDAGMFQGGRWADEANHAQLPLRQSALDAIVLTHAHIDHCGLLPRWCKGGNKKAFRGRVHATRATADLVPVMLRDGAHIQETDAAHHNRRALRRGGKPVEPLYTAEDAEKAIARLVPHEFGEVVQVTDDVAVRFRPAGHIIGAASVEVTVTAPDGAVRRIALSGDLGRRDQPLVCDPVPPDFDGVAPDLVLCESTYGDREHKTHGDTHAELLAILERAHASGGTVVIPVFAVGRAQELLLALRRAFLDRPDLERPVVLDSPMAIRVTGLYQEHGTCFRAGLSDELEEQLTADGATFDGFEPRTVELTRTADESRALNGREGLVILSASGMCDAGRIRHHLKHRLWREDDQVVVVGYQARGSLGRRIVEGAERVRLMGEDVVVRAGVHTLGGFSAHAGRGSLLRWIDAVAGADTQVVLNHGEDEARASLAAALRADQSRTAWTPAPRDRIILPADGPPELLAETPD